MKRTELKRQTPMKRGPGPKRTGRLKPYSKRRAKRDANLPGAREAVHERAGGVCEYAGFDWMTNCHEPMAEVHHIRGRRIPDPHALTNLVGLCKRHHDRAHAEPEWARSAGLMASRIGGTR